MRISFSVLLLCILLAGCVKTQGVRIEIQEVYVPVICQISPPPKPTKSGNVISDVANLSVYTKLLESTLESCLNPNKESE